MATTANKGSLATRACLKRRSGYKLNSRLRTGLPVVSDTLVPTNTRLLRSCSVALKRLQVFVNPIGIGLVPIAKESHERDGTCCNSKKHPATKKETLSLVGSIVSDATGRAATVRPHVSSVASKIPGNANAVWGEITARLKVSEKAGEENGRAEQWQPDVDQQPRS